MKFLILIFVCSILFSCSTTLRDAQNDVEGITCIDIDTATLFSVFTATAHIRTVSVQGLELSVEDAERLLSMCFGTTEDRLIKMLQAQPSG